MKIYISGKNFVEDHLTKKDFEEITQAKIRELTEKAREIAQEMQTAATN